MRITIEKIVYPGKSLGRENGKIILTDQGLPGEVLDVAVIKEHKNYIEAKTERVITPSAHRSTPRCSHYTVCSSYQYIDYAGQTTIKEKQCKEILSHTLKTDIPFAGFRAAENPWEYRNKLHLHILRDQHIRLAYHNPGSHDQFIPVDRCQLASAAMNDLLAVLAKIIEQGSFNGINEIIIRQNRAHDQLLLALVGKLSHDEQQRLVGESAAITASFPLCGIVYRNPATRTGKTLWGSNAIQDTIAGLTFSYGVESFFQINPAMAEKLIADLRVSLPLTAQSRIADLFCGVGLFGIILAPDVKQVSFIEADLDNAGFLKQNIRANHITNGTVQTGDCERWTRKPAHAHYDAVIVDPPRRGLGKTFCTALIKNAPGYIAYVSCDPATLARDCKDLLPAYEPQRLQAYDFFPQTPHIETLTILKKR